jgi:hypothetical protein
LFTLFNVPAAFNKTKTSLFLYFLHVLWTMVGLASAGKRASIFFLFGVSALLRIESQMSLANRYNAVSFSVAKYKTKISSSLVGVCLDGMNLKA